MKPYSLITKSIVIFKQNSACNIVIFERRMIAYSSLRLYLPLIRLSTLPLFLCWIKQLITLHCGTRRQWRPLLLYRAIHKAKRPALLREETDEWGIRRTYIRPPLDLRIHIRSFILLDIFFIETALSRYIDFISDQLLPRSTMDFERSWTRDEYGVEDRRESIYNSNVDGSFFAYLNGLISRNVSSEIKYRVFNRNRW